MDAELNMIFYQCTRLDLFGKKLKHSTQIKDYFMRTLTVNEIQQASGGFYFSAPFIGAAIGYTVSKGNLSATLGAAAASTVALVPWCPLHWALGAALGVASLISAGVAALGGSSSK